MAGSNAAAAILAGIPGLQDSARMKVEAGAAFGNAIAHTGVAIGGIFRAAAQKKVEDDYGVVDNAFQAAMASGRPDEMTRVLTAIAPTIKTAKGKAYLADKMGKSFGIRSDMLDIETKKMKLEREKKAPVRTGILFKAQKGDENALAEAMALGDEDFQKEVGGALAVSKSGARAASDQQIQEQDRAEKKRVETMGTKAANELAALIAQDPSLKDKPWKMSQMMSESGKYDLAVQKDAMAKLAVFFGLDQKEDAQKVAEAKVQSKQALLVFQNTLQGAGTLDALNAMRIPEGGDIDPEAARRAIANRRGAIMGERRLKIATDSEGRATQEFDEKVKGKDRAVSEKAFAHEMTRIKTVLASAPKDMNGNIDWQTWMEENPLESGRARGFLTRLNDAAAKGILAITVDPTDGFPQSVKINAPTSEQGAYSYKTTDEWTKAAGTVPAEEKEAFKAAYLAWKSGQGK